MEPTLVVLGAGTGSRYGGLKQIDPVGPKGETVSDYWIRHAQHTGFAKVVFVIRRDIECAFRCTVDSRRQDSIEIGYAFQELDMVPVGVRVPPERDKPWGTGHAVLAARDVVAGPFAVVPANGLCGVEVLERLVNELSFMRRNRCCTVGFSLGSTLSGAGPASRDICTVGPDGCLAGIEVVEGIRKARGGAMACSADGTPRKLDRGTTVSMDMWGFSSSFFTQLESEFAHFVSKFGTRRNAEFSIAAAVNRMTEAGIVATRVLKTGSPWFGLVTRDDRPIVMAGLRKVSRHRAVPAGRRTGSKASGASRCRRGGGDSSVKTARSAAEEPHVLTIDLPVGYRLRAAFPATDAPRALSGVRTAPVRLFSTKQETEEWQLVIEKGLAKEGKLT